jgi:plasmid replication initiation protein
MTTIDLRKKVRIHESLTETLSQISLKELEYETMFFLFAKISKSHRDETNYNLSLNEFQELTKRKHNLEEYKSTIKKLRSITFEIESEEEILIDGILSSARYIKNKGVMQVKISAEMKPFLLELTQNYNEHQLYSILRLTSKHAKKLYLYLNSHRPTCGKYRSIIEMQTIEDFKIRLGYKNQQTGEELYKKWNHFNERVLKVAKEEINAVSNIKVAYNTKKFGREVYWIEWIIENKSNKEIINLEQFNSNSITSSNKDLKEQLKDISDFEKLTKVYGLNEEQAKKALRMIERERLFAVISGIDKQKEKQIINNLGGYTVATLNKEFELNL